MQFSIIIPTYNRAEFLPRAINSVLGQTYRDFELIIVDDGSTDNTREVVAGFDDPRIRYFHKKNEERSAARNFGAAKSKGSHICFLDSDEEIKPGHLQCFEEGIAMHPSVHVFRTQYTFHHQDGTSYTSEFSPKVPDAGDIWRTFYPVASYCISRTVAGDIRWPEQFWIWEDKHYFLRVVMKYEIAELPCVTSVFYDHAGRSVHEVDPDRFRDKIWQIENSVMDLWKEHSGELQKFVSSQEMKDWISDQLRGIAYDAIAAKEPRLARDAVSAAWRYTRPARIPHWLYTRMKVLLS